MKACIRCGASFEPRPYHLKYYTWVCVPCPNRRSSENGKARRKAKTDAANRVDAAKETRYATPVLKNRYGSRPGYKKSSGGYVAVLRPDHPRATGHGYVFEHVLIAESALGHPLPAAAEVHHFNEVKSDNRSQNLVICENRRYHQLLHARARIVRAGGDPNTQKVCGGCREVKAHAAFAKCKTWYDGLTRYCRDCYRRFRATRTYKQSA